MRVSSFRRRTSSALVLATSIALGTAGAVLAYRTVAGPAPAPASAPPVVALPSAAADPVPQKPIIRLAPCKAPAVLERGACVTHVVREVVVPAPAAAVPVATARTSDEGRSGGGERRAASSRGSQERHSSGGDREEREDRDDQEDREDRGEDREDHEDDHESDHESDHEDEDHEDD